LKCAVYFGSREIYWDMVSAAKSLLAHSDVDKIYYLIEDDEYPFETSPSIETINISKLIWEIYDPSGANVQQRWTYIGLIRSALTKVFPDLDKILTIDCDTIVTQDISDLWDIPLDDYYFAAVKEPALSAMTHGLYTNSGVAMMNLKKLREDGKDDEMIRLLNTRALYFVCQDAMNACCQGKILEISNEYNANRYTGTCYNQKVIHYAGLSNWRFLDIVKEYREMEWPR